MCPSLLHECPAARKGRAALRRLNLEQPFASLPWQVDMILAFRTAFMEKAAALQAKRAELARSLQARSSSSAAQCQASWRS